MSGYLSAKLASDRTAAAGNEYRFSFDKVIDLLHIGLYGITAEKVFDIYLFHSPCGDIALDVLIHTGELTKLAVCLGTYIKDSLSVTFGSAGDSEVDLIYIVLRNIFYDSISSADNGNIIHIAVPFVGIVIYNAYYFFGKLVGMLYITEYHLSRFTCTDKHDL